MEHRMPCRQDRQSIRAQLDANYHQIASELLRQQLATMHAIYGLFGGDFEAFYILAVIAQRTAEHQAFKASPWTGRRDDQPLPSLTTNVRSVAQSTGIPEETVRRKVMALVARGWVQKEGRCLSYTVQGARELGPLRDALLDLAVQHYRIVAAKLCNN
jgi:hypothetical protein